MNKKIKKEKKNEEKKKELVLRSNKMKFLSYLNSLINSYNSYIQVLPTVTAYNFNDYYNIQSTDHVMHHWRTLDASHDCFRVTVNSPTSYNVEIVREIKLFHDLSISGRWGGNIIITINKNWGINMSFNTPNGWIQNNQWIYGRLWFQSGDVVRESTRPRNQYGVDIYERESTYTRSCYYTNDATYSNNVSYKNVVLQPFRFGGDSNKNFSHSVGSENFPTSVRTFTGNNPPNSNEQYYLNDPGTNSIYVLRYQVFLQGYYDRTPRDSMIVLMSGDLKVKLPGYKNESLGEIYSYTAGTITRSEGTKNGDGLVYHRSDCGYPNVRMYGFGGDGPGTACGQWVSGSENRYILTPNSGLVGGGEPLSSNPDSTLVQLSDLDIVWFGVNNDPDLKKAARNKYNFLRLGKNYDPTWMDFKTNRIKNWRLDELNISI